MAKAAGLTRAARLDAVQTAFTAVASGKAGNSKTGAKVQVGRLEGSTRSAWWNFIWRINPANTSGKVNERLYRATVTGDMPLVVERKITFLALTGDQVAEVRKAYKS